MSYEFYELGETLIEKIPPKLLYITKSKYDKGWHSTQHTHHFTELFYIVSGKGYFLLPDKEIPVKENDLVIINPHVEHTEQSNQEDSLEYIALGITGISFTLPDNDDRQLGIYTYRGDQATILFFLNMLLDEAKISRLKFEVICQNLLEILTIKLERKNFTIEKAETKHMNTTASFIKNYIDNNFHEQLTLNHLADIAHINKFYLAHIFKKSIGISPIDYLNETRIKKAKYLLKNTNHTIASIATINGFSSQSFFSQAFKRATNTTPSTYRKKTRKKVE